MVRETSPVILVVEDDSAVRQPLVKFLQMRQYTVVTAETADEGLDAIKTHRPAAAIIDLRLRRGSGREVVVSDAARMPVIIFSGLRSESADLETIRPNTRLVEKPYSLVMLMDTLEDMLEQSQRQPERLRPHRRVVVGGNSHQFRRSLKNALPNAESASSVPSSAVVLRMSSVGLTSTRSNDVSLPDSATISITTCASR